jgi:hypothetical protein
VRIVYFSSDLDAVAWLPGLREALPGVELNWAHIFNMLFAINYSCGADTN